MPTNAPLNRKLRMGLIGGGQGAFIGRVHSIAAVLDNRAELVAGALSSDPARAKASAPDYDIKDDRAYGSVKEMIAAELKLPAEKRVDFVSVATPNHTHYEISKAFAEAGFNVICDKPLTFDLAQAEDLAKVVAKSGVVFGVTHNYTGYPLVRQAREMIAAGELGEINAVRAFYIQGWLRTKLEGESQKQATWRTDPKSPEPPAASATSRPTPTTSPATPPASSRIRCRACSRPSSMVGRSTITARR
ncbi:MAG: Gfo/Idh/MocA family oxidoreductase [Gemmataceae bacterium]